MCWRCSTWLPVPSRPTMGRSAASPSPWVAAPPPGSSDCARRRRRRLLPRSRSRRRPTAKDPKLAETIDQAALALSERALVERLVHRLGEARVPPEEREAVVAAVAALASLSMGLVLDAFLAAPVDLRAPYRGAVR